MHERMAREIRGIRRHRESSEEEMIALLEKVVERIRAEVVKM